MNGVNFNVVTPNVNYAKLSDESTDKPTEQVNFKGKPNINNSIIDSLNNKAADLLNKKRPVAEQKEVAIRNSVGMFFERFGNFFKKLKNIGEKRKERKEAVRNQQVVDFASDTAKYFENKRLGRNIEADIYRERMRKFLES